MQFTDLIFRTVKRIARSYSVIFWPVCTRTNECIICMREAGDYARCRNVRNVYRARVNRALITRGLQICRGVFRKFFESYWRNEGDNVSLKCVSPSAGCIGVAVGYYTEEVPCRAREKGVEQNKIECKRALALGSAILL